VPAKPEAKQAQLIRKKPEQKLGDTPLEDFARRQARGFHSTSADWASDPVFIEKTESVSISRQPRSSAPSVLCSQGPAP
jgi:hypothetical protein